MSETTRPSFERECSAVLATRLAEPRRFLHVVAGPRQVGKTTLVLQELPRVLAGIEAAGMNPAQSPHCRTGTSGEPRSRRCATVRTQLGWNPLRHSIGPCR